MTDGPDELDRLRGALDEAERRNRHERATVEVLRAELGEYRREAQHQVRNILSVVRSIARRTAEEGETAEDYRARLDGRLGSFTRLQGHFLQNPTGGVDLCALVADELLAFGVGAGRRTACRRRSYLPEAEAGWRNRTGVS